MKVERSKKEGPTKKARNNKCVLKFCFDENSLVKKYVMMMGQNFSAEK